MMETARQRVTRALRRHVPQFAGGVAVLELRVPQIFELDPPVPKPNSSAVQIRHTTLALSSGGRELSSSAGWCS